METLDIPGLEELAGDHTETRRRVVFVLGALDEAAMQVFLDMQNHAYGPDEGPLRRGQVAALRTRGGPVPRGWCGKDWSLPGEHTP